MKNILVSFVFFALLLLLLPEVFAMDKGPGQAPLPVGGECQYDTVRGIATIVSIDELPSLPWQSRADHSEDSPGAGHEIRYEIRFEFSPLDPDDEHARQIEGKLFLLLDNQDRYPDEEFLKYFRVEAGRKYHCYVHLITKGACTPILYSIPDFGICKCPNGW